MKSRRRQVDTPEGLRVECAAAHEEFQRRMADLAVRRDQRHTEVLEEREALIRQAEELSREAEALGQLPIRA